MAGPDRSRALRNLWRIMGYFLAFSLIVGDVDVAFGIATLERSAMLRLQRTASQPGVQLQTFTTDGCSGGLSAGWNALSEALPLFRQKFADRPPYEDCCVEHDRQYWRGRTDRGYERRLAADADLRACVVEHGRSHRDEYARLFGLPAVVIDRNFRLTADLMYAAVRAGGGPCTPLPWRWGYGWPLCGL